MFDPPLQGRADDVEVLRAASGQKPPREMPTQERGDLHNALLGRGEVREAGGHGGRERLRNPRGREQLLDQERHPIGDTDNTLDVLGGGLGPTRPHHGSRFRARQRSSENAWMLLRATRACISW